MKYKSGGFVHKEWTQKKSDSVLDAARHIRTYPYKYHFSQVLVPRDLDDCGCVLGWVSHFAGKKLFLYYRDLDSTAKWLGYKNSLHFYNAMDRVVGSKKWISSPDYVYDGLFRLLNHWHCRKPQYV